MIRGGDGGMRSLTERCVRRFASARITFAIGFADNYSNEATENLVNERLIAMDHCVNGGTGLR
jgi:hypothetical protein